MNKLFILICTSLLVCGCNEFETKVDSNGNTISTGVYILQDDSVQKYRYKDHYYLYIAPILGNSPQLIHDPDCPCKSK